ncbi:MAG: tetratricopeptide repeat protein [Gemmatimonadetes bacterium]|nr:tetratricopeptide repeat protein [Gemmatimonadota bacterium]
MVELDLVPAETPWSEENDRGLALAADGAWDAAAAAFARACHLIEASQPLAPAAHEPLALVLGNLAHACYRAGALDDALVHGQRACTVRVAIAGEDAMPVARARMDLAVMLAAAQRGDEALALVRRALAALEHRVGAEDVRLVVLLENAARIALALGATADAEPLLLRLHALLASHGLSTSRAEDLLTRVARLRASAEPMAPETPPEAPTPVEPAVAVALPEMVPLDAPPLLTDDDRPLREAVAVTDTLLRTTPVPLTPRGQAALTAIPEPIANVTMPPPAEPTPPTAPEGRSEPAPAPRALRVPRVVGASTEKTRGRMPLVAGLVVAAAAAGGAAWWFLLR